jgi:hypothetical protein
MWNEALSNTQKDGVVRPFFLIKMDPFTDKTLNEDPHPTQE